MYTGTLVPTAGTHLSLLACTGLACSTGRDSQSVSGGDVIALLREAAGQDCHGELHSGQSKLSALAATTINHKHCGAHSFTICTAQHAVLVIV
jgi:hypothetical protein